MIILLLSYISKVKKKYGDIIRNHVIYIYILLNRFCYFINLLILLIFLNYWLCDINEVLNIDKNCYLLTINLR